MALLIEQAINGLQFGILLFLLSAGLTLVFVREDLVEAKDILTQRGSTPRASDSARHHM